MEDFFEFYIKNKKIKIPVRICKSIWSQGSGLMFRKRIKPLLFVFNREKMLVITSIFCQPFIAIWISPSRKATKILKITKWGFNFSGKGQYLIEIPKYDENYLIMTKILNLPDGK